MPNSGWLAKRARFYKEVVGRPLKVTVVALVSVIAAAGAVRDVLLPPAYKELYVLKYIPLWAWYWWVLAGLVVVLLVVLESSFRVASSREAQVNPLALGSSATGDSPDIASRRTAIKSKVEPRDQAKSNIICSDSPIVPAHFQLDAFDRNETIVEGWDEYRRGWDHSRELVAAVAEFSNEPDPPRKVAGIYDVSAQVIYYDGDGKLLRRVNRGLWLGEEHNRVEFGVNDALKLIIGVVPKSDEPKMHAVESSYDNSSTVGAKCWELDGTSFKVKVRLVAEREGTVLKEFDFGLTMTLEPEFDIKLAELR